MEKSVIKDCEKISDIQDYLKNLYPRNDDVSIDYLYGFAVQAIAYLGKNIIKEEAKPKHFVKSISWIFALGTKLDIDIRDSYIRKFPDCCPYCVQPICKCDMKDGVRIKIDLGEKDNNEIEQQYHSQKSSNQLLTLDQCARNINKIYPSNKGRWEFARPLYHCFKMIEEIGEFHEAYNSKRKPIEAVASELIETLAWILGAWDIYFPNKQLKDSFIDRYKYGCPVCIENPCNCEMGSAPVEEGLNVESLKEIEKILRVISQEEELHNEKPKIEDCEKTIERAIKKEDKTIAFQARERTTPLMKKLLEKASTTGDLSKNINAVLSLFDNLF